MIQAVIFDLDGVIADSEPIHETAENAILEELGAKDIEYSTGVRFEDLLRRASLKKGISVDIKVVMGRKFDIMMGFAESLKPIEHSIKLINSLSGVKLAVVSGSTKNWVEFSLRKFGLNKKFDVVVTSEDFEKGKPDPEPFVIAAGMLGVNPTDCIVIEDSSAGVKSAKAAGMKCIGYVSPHSHRQNLSIADYVVQDLMDVKRFL